jgi:hypothetical protein
MLVRAKHVDNLFHHGLIAPVTIFSLSQKATILKKFPNPFLRAREFPLTLKSLILFTASSMASLTMALAAAPAPAAATQPGAAPASTQLRSCLAAFKRDMDDFSNDLNDGVKRRRINEKEKVPLSERFDSLKAREKWAYENNALDMKECDQLHLRLQNARRSLQMAISSQDPKPEPLNITRDSLKACQDDLTNQSALLKSRIDEATKNNQLDPKEQSYLATQHAEIVAMLNKAQQDRRGMGAHECNGIYIKINETNNALIEATINRPTTVRSRSATVPVSGSVFQQPPASHPTANQTIFLSPMERDCQISLKGSLTSYRYSIDLGVKAGQINANKLAELNAKYTELLALEQKVNRDNKVDLNECRFALSQAMVAERRFSSEVARGTLSVHPALAPVKK